LAVLALHLFFIVTANQATLEKTVLIAREFWVMVTQLWELSCHSFPFQQFFSLLEFAVPMAELAGGKEDVHTNTSSPGKNLP